MAPLIFLNLKNREDYIIMSKDRVEILKREIVGADINDISKGALLLAIEGGELSDFVLEKLYDNLVAKREKNIAPEILAKEVDINLNFIELLKQITPANFIETVKVLKVKYGISYNATARAGRMSQATLNAMIHYGFESDRIAEGAITALKEFYLGQYYKTILEKI